MSVFVSEFRKAAALAYGVAASLPALGNQVLAISGATVSTGQLGTATEMIYVSADTGAMLLLGSSTAALTPTSTNGFRIPAGGQPIPFAVQPNNKLFACST